MQTETERISNCDIFGDSSIDEILNKFQFNVYQQTVCPICFRVIIDEYNTLNLEFLHTRKKF